MIVLESSLLWQIVNNFHAICSSFHMRIIFLFYIMLCWNEFGIFSIADKFDRCNCIRFLLKLSKSSTETIVVRRSTSGKHSNVWNIRMFETFEWLKHSNVRSRRRVKRPTNHPQDVRCKKIRTLIHKNHWRTIHQLYPMIRISYRLFQEILFLENSMSLPNIWVWPW